MASNFDLYSPIAIDAANRYGIDPNVFLWQIGKESSWNPNAQSPTSSAGGIAQFINSTAAWLGVDKWNVSSALTGAAKYDSMLLNGKCNGDYSCMLNSYGTTAGNPALQQEANQVINGSAGTGAQSSSSDCPWYDLLCLTGARQLANAAGGAVADSKVGANVQGWIGRGVLIALGLIFLAGAVYLYKS